jgi:IS6 family transposase
VQVLSAFTGFLLTPEVILRAVRWHLRYRLSYRVRRHFHERGIDVDNVTPLPSGHRFGPLLIDAARPCRHAVGYRWFVDETYVKVAGVWRHVHRAVDQHGQVVTDRAPALANVIEDLIPAAFHNTSQYENNRRECDHGRLKARVWPMRGLKTDRPRASSYEDMRLSRTCSTANTSWESRPRRSTAWRSQSTNSSSQSDRFPLSERSRTPCDHPERHRRPRGEESPSQLLPGPPRFAPLG